MIENLRMGFSLLREFSRPNGRRFAALEFNRGCNRECPECKVPSLYKREEELTLVQTFKAVDFVKDHGYPLVTCLGGESLAPFKTKEGLSFAEHTLQVVNYASSRGIMTNVVTNGDYLSEPMMRALKDAHLGSLSLSFHSSTRAGLNHLIEYGRLAAQAGIIPVITTVINSKNARMIPGIASYVVEKGIIFGFGVVQAKNKFLSSGRDDFIPSTKQLEEMASALLGLKTFGFIRNNRSYLRNVAQFHPQNFVCNPNNDVFIHIGAGGSLDVCSDIRTEHKIVDVKSLKESEKWREAKRVGVKDCGGCSYHCYIETENPNVLGDIPMFAVGLLIKSGRSNLVKKLGKVAVDISKQKIDVNWNLTLV